MNFLHSFVMSLSHFDVANCLVMSNILSILELIIYAPRIAGIILGNVQALHRFVTSDIPGNPHAFDDCIISLFRTLPEPSNFNIVWTSLPLGESLIIRGEVPPSRISSISIYGKGSSEPPSSLDIESIARSGYFQKCL